MAGLSQVSKIELRSIKFALRTWDWVHSHTHTGLT